MIGFDVHEDNREFKSDDVKRFTTVSMSYPCFIINKSLEVFRLNVLKKMFSVNQTFNDETQFIEVYFTDGERTVRLGRIMSIQVKSFLKLFEQHEVTGYYDENTPISGDYLYTLSS